MLLPGLPKSVEIVNLAAGGHGRAGPGRGMELSRGNFTIGKVNNRQETEPVDAATFKMT